MHDNGCYVKFEENDADRASPPAPALDQKNSPSRFPFRPPLSMTFPLRVLPSNSASTYSGSVLGARGNLGAGHGRFKGVELRGGRNLRKFNFPHFHSRVCSLWITPSPARVGKVRPCRTFARRRPHTGSPALEGAARADFTLSGLGEGYPQAAHPAVDMWIIEFPQIAALACCETLEAGLSRP